MTLATAILQAARELDPYHQADCWPDPIAWDGRPLLEQATDLLPLLEADREETDPDSRDEIDRVIADLRRAMAEAD